MFFAGDFQVFFTGGEICGVSILLCSFVLVLLAAQSLMAATYYVGNCKVHSGYYTTIQAAVSAVPSGSTVEVCPGIYYEQVVISQPLTLEAIPNWSTGTVTISDAGILR